MALQTTVEKGTPSQYKFTINQASVSIQKSESSSFIAPTRNVVVQPQALPDTVFITAPYLGQTFKTRPSCWVNSCSPPVTSNVSRSGHI